MSRVELADKLIIKSRRLNSFATALGFLVIAVTLMGLTAEANNKPAIHLSIFGIDLERSTISFFGPPIIITFQMLTFSYLTAFSALLKSDSSLFGKVTEPWVPLYLRVFSGQFILLISQMLPALAVLGCFFLGLDENGKVELTYDAHIFYLIIPGLSVFLSWRIAAIVFGIANDSFLNLLRSKDHLQDDYDQHKQDE